LESQAGEGGLPLSLVAHDGGEPLGTVSLIFDDLPGFTHLNPWLAGLYVLPAHREKGVATALVREAERRFVEAGHHEAWLFTESARPLFETLGWKFFQEATCHGHPVVILRKNLAPLRATS
jgi:predicted N-acetyltransferase YhbS